MKPSRIEEISLNAWPALQQILLDGWILRFSRGFTKRANSVNPLYRSTMELPLKVAICEELYRVRGLRPTFRLTPFSSPPELDAFLAVRGYDILHPTLVLQRNLGEEAIAVGGTAKLRHENLDDWLALFCQLQKASPDKHGTHRAILANIPGDKCLASLVETAGRSVACGLGVLEGDAVGLFDLITDPAERRKGHGTLLVANILRWAQERGARYAYLQVMEANKPAQKLYAKFGFQETYRYWYRVPTMN
jgi:ribosomal protein S18 acetylase RimI-like enzyme